MHEEDEVVQRALAALLRWGIDAHLGYCCETVLLEQVVAGRREPPLRGKLPYAALLESLLRYGDGRLGYETLGRGSAAPQVFPGTCPQLAGACPKTWMWARAAINLFSPPEDEQPSRQLARLCIAVSQQQIRAVELINDDVPPWHPQPHPPQAG
jgi:hypothetical protein